MATLTAPKTPKKTARTTRTMTRRSREPSEAELQAYLADMDRRMAENARGFDELLVKLQAKPSV
jgi:hypothetical protein